MRSPPTGCGEFRKRLWDRRELLTAGAAAGMGLFLPDILRAREARLSRPSGSTFGRARSVIIIYLHGGHAQQETWDPKPEGPSAVRGEFGAISTSVPGTHISELLPRCAQLMHKFAVIRSLSHANANHVQASLPAMTGHVHPPSVRGRGDFPPSPSDFPPFGAVINTLRPAGKLPNWVQVGPLMRRNNGTVLHGQLPGFVGASQSSLVIDQDLQGDDIRMETVAPRADVPVLRFSERRNLLEQVDAQRRDLEQALSVQTFNDYHRRAAELLSSSDTARAFDIASESQAVRDRYGRNQFGQCCLLARRLAEAAVPVINVHFCETPRGSWDTHGRHFTQMKDYLCPMFDQALSALVSELDDRGLLSNTLVLPTAEFGRTPRINQNAGRDHWPWVYSVPLAGAGIAAGTVYGASDNMAAHPVSNPHDPRDLAATVYHLLGVPADTIVHDQISRPHSLIIGQKIDGILL